MCNHETRDWTGCACSPEIHEHRCSDDIQNIMTCPHLRITATFPGFPCETCRGQLPTPPLTPEDHMSPPSPRVQQLKTVFETRKLRSSGADTDYPRGKRHRRDSVGKLDDKCTECRVKSLPCDRGEGQCSNCIRLGVPCETAAEWFGRVSAIAAGRVPRSRSSSVSSESGRYSSAQPEESYDSIEELTSQLEYKSTPIKRTSSVHPYDLNTTAGQLADLKKNIRGLKSALNMNLPKLEPISPEKPGNFVGIEYSPEYDETCISLDDDILNLVEEGLFNPLVEAPQVLDADTGTPSVVSPSAIFDETLDPFAKSLEALKAHTGMAYRSATEAHAKLKRAALQPNVSPGFRAFVNKSLGTVDQILNLGASTFEGLLDGHMPSSLEETYSFLHFAYAMSQADPDDPLHPSAEKLEFQRGLLAFRSCLPSTPEYFGNHSQRDIFDEIAHVMAGELECALRWVRKKKVMPETYNVLSSTDVLRLHTIMGEELGVAPSREPDKVEPDEPGEEALEIVGGYLRGTTTANCLRSLPVFTGLKRFLKGLERLSPSFDVFMGSQCHSVASGLYKRPEYSKRLLWEPGYAENAMSTENQALTRRNTDELIRIVESTVFEPSSLTMMFPPASKLWKTALDMFDLGSLITISDLQDYAVGLVRVLTLPNDLSNWLSGEVQRICLDIIGLLPTHLYGRVFPDLNNIETMFTPQESLPCVSGNGDSSQLDVEMVDNFCYLSDLGPTMPFLVAEGMQSSSSSSNRHFLPADIRGTERIAAIAFTPVSPPPTLPISTSPRSCSTEYTPSPSAASTSPCPAENHVKHKISCSECPKTFSTTSNYRRHMSTQHCQGSPASIAVQKCPVENCNAILRGKRGVENLRTHLKRNHGILVKDPREITLSTEGLMELGC